ncbi:DUF1616 domain-containing protein [bacterium]|nr:DUF1616 domain-containing protein [bacterium]
MVIYKIVAVILGLVGVALGFSIWLGIEQSFRIVFGSVYVLFLPGLVLTFVFFKREEIDIIERIALSFALSIAVVPLLVFYLNLIGMKINPLNVSLVIAGIIILALGIIFRHKLGIKKLRS